jgi:DNA replication initiation complex subunit (GINS family)
MFAKSIEEADEIMYSVRRRILSITLIAMMMAGWFSAAAEEAQSFLDEAATEAVGIMDSEPASLDTASETPASQESEALEPQADATAEHAATVEPENTVEPEDASLLVEIPDEQVPLAGGQDPIVSVRANRGLVHSPSGTT